MREKMIEIEAENLEEAREQIKAQIPEGLQLLSERVIFDGRPKVTARADSLEAAYAEARKRLPADAVILEKRELASPESLTIVVESADDIFALWDARKQAREKFGDGAVAKEIKLMVAGKKGFLSNKKTKNLYEAEIFRPACVEITYKARAKISAHIGEKLLGEVGFYQYDMESLPRWNGFCSDPDCPCPGNGTPIPKGSGYLYISPEAVVIMKAKNERRIGGDLVVLGPMPMLVCEQAAKLRSLDLEAAADDARRWWENGKVPLRSTPIVGNRDNLSGKGKAESKSAIPAEAEPKGLRQLIQDYVATRATDLSDQSEWITAFAKYGEEALPFLERAIANNWRSHPGECADLLYAIGWIGGDRAIEILAALKESKLTSGTLLTPIYGEHERFVPTAIRIYQRLRSS
jgi:hypothetical protein